MVLHMVNLVVDNQDIVEEDIVVVDNLVVDILVGERIVVVDIVIVVEDMQLVSHQALDQQSSLHKKEEYRQP